VVKPDGSFDIKA